MKILIRHSKPHHQGWYNAIKKMGYDPHFWPAGKPAFDIFAELEPDVFIGAASVLDRATVKCVDARPNLVTKIEVDVPKWQHAWMKIPDKIAQFSHIPYQGDTVLPLAFDNTETYLGVSRKELISDIAFIDQYDEQLVLELAKRYSVRVYGNVDCSLPNYMGQIEYNDIADIAKSAGAVINLTIDSDLLYRVLAYGGRVYTREANYFARVFNIGPLTADVFEVASDIDLDGAMASRSTDVLKYHTYEKRMQGLFKEFSKEEVIF